MKKKLVVICKNCREKIRSDLVERGKIFCSETCKALYRRKAYYIAMPERTFGQLTYLQSVTGKSRMDLIESSVSKYVEYYQEKHKK